MGFTAGSGRPTPIEPPKPTPPPMSGGKGAGRVSPIVESRPMFSGINDINKMSSQRPGRVLTDPVPPRAGGKGAARVQPTSTPAATQEQAGTPLALGGSEESTELGEKLINMGSNTMQQAGQQSDTITAPPPTPIRGGGKAGPTADRVASVTPQPMPMTPPPAPMTPPPIPPSLDNPVFRSLGQQQAAQQPQQSITGMNTNTGSTNSIPAPQSAIFKQGGLIGLMRRR